MAQPRRQLESIKTQGRSRTTNGKQLLHGIDGRSVVARRLRDIVRGLLVEFDATSQQDELLVRDAAALSVISEQLQAKMVRGEPVDFRTVGIISGQLRRTLTNLRQRNSQRGPAPQSLHEHLASFHERLDPDDDEDGDQ